MSQRPGPLRDRLRSIDAGRAERQTRLIAALNARTIDGATLGARLAFERDRRAVTAWIRFRGGGSAIYLAPLLLDGALARLARSPDGPDPAAAAAMLARIEPLVVALEAALGCELYPDGLETAGPIDAILLRIDASRPGGAIRDRLLAAFAPDGAVAAPVLLPSVPAALDALRWPWSATLDGPSLRPGRVATIRAGDMMLLGLRPLMAQVRLPGRARRAGGQIDLIRGTMTLQNEVVDDPARGQGAAAPAAAAAASRPIDWEDMRVPTVVEIDGAMVSAGQVAGLAGGSVLALPSSGGTLPVRVIAGGTVIGTGELVALGEGFGVLFTSVAADGDRAS